MVEQCRAQLPDLIITDISMPDMDGIEAACQITNEHPVPVIVISSRDTTELDNCGARKYVVAFLRKPIKMEQLATAVSEAAECDVLPRSREM